MRFAHLLDTSALLAHLLQEKGWETVEHCLSAAGGKAAVSALTWVEFQLFLQRSDYAKADATRILEIYRECLGAPLPIDEAVGNVAVALRAQSPVRIPLSDLLIAACAKRHGAKLVFRDKHLESIPEKALPQIRLPDK